MLNNNVKVNFKKLQKILYDLSNVRLHELLEQYQIKHEVCGPQKLYLISEITQLKKDLEQRYNFNKENRIEAQELISLGIPNPSTVFKKILKQPIDRIHEFKSTTYFYDRKEVEEFLLERQIVKDSLSIEAIQRELGITYYKITLEIIKTAQVVPIALKYFNKLKYFNVDDVKKVKNLMKKQYAFNKKNRLTHKQISEYYKLKSSDISKLSPIKTTALDRINEFYNCNYFFDKEEVINFAKQGKFSFGTYSTKEVMNMFNTSDSVNFLLYLRKLDIFPIKLKGYSQFRWSKEKVDDLLKRKETLLETYNNKFINLAEFEEYFSVEFNAVQRVFDKIGEEIKIYQIPDEIRIDNLEKFYKKYHLLAYEDLDYILKVLINNTSVNNLEEIIARKEDFFKEIDINSLSLNPERARGFKFSLLGFDEKTTQEFLNYTGIPSINVLKKEIEKLTSSKNIISNYIISKDQILKRYNISFTLFKHLWDLNNDQIKYIKKSNLIFFALKDIELLFGNLISSQMEFLEDYYTNSDVNKLNLTYHQVADTKTIEVPSHLKFGVFSKKTRLYPKIEVHKVIQELKLRDFFLSYKNHDELLLMPSKLYNEIIQVLKLEFNMCNYNPAINQTVTYWNKYVQKNLDSSHANKFSLHKLLIKSVRLMHIISELFQEKEIFLWTIDEIENILFQHKIPKTWCVYFTAFLSFVHSKRVTKYKIEDVSKLRRKFEVIETPRDTEVYTTEEFIELINYVCDVSYHKNEAIKELTSPKQGKRIYYEYSSVWLYVLMHLNNAWRSTDIIEKIPRISLPDSINSIKKFRSHELSTVERRSILFEISGKLFDIHHNKNLKQAYFFCAEKLEEAFVNAAILCELKCRLERPLVNNLIKLDAKNHLGETLHKAFFKKFKIQGFTFKSLKANSSYLKILKSVLNHFDSTNVMTILELQRNHGSLDVTKRYTPISTQEADLILKNLASVGYFGYTYTLLTNMLLGKQGVEVTTKSIMLLKEVFGDIYKVENFITQINNIEKANLDVAVYLEKLEKNELENLFGLISLGKKPAKQEHWQCILGDCLYLDKNCENCPFAIPNYYVLDSILKKLTKHMEDYEKYFELSIHTELVKSSKLIHRYLLILSAAKKKFGENAISSFLGYDYTLFKEKLSKLNDFKHYLYLREDIYD